MSPIRATVVIVNYNGGEKVLACLASIRRTTPPDFEVVVVDNASRDGSPDRIAEGFSSVRLIRSPENLGFGGGNNLGAREARGAFLVFVNPDTVVEEGWAEPLLAPLVPGSEVGLTTAKVLLADGRRINTCGNAVHLTGLTLCRGLGEPRERLARPEEVAAVSGAAFAIRAELFRDLGGFDEDFFLYMEDTELSWRARLAGWTCLYVPESVVRHDYELRITPRKVFYQERNRYVMLVKTLRWPTLLLLLPAYALAEVVTWGFVLRSDRPNARNKVEAYVSVARSWRSILARRRSTQRLRRARDRDLLRLTGYRLEFRQAAGARTAAAARWVFDPLFFVLRALARAFIHW